MNSLRQADNRFASTDREDIFLEGEERMVRPPAPCRTIPVTAEMRARDAAERRAREEKMRALRNPVTAHKPCPSERDLDRFWEEQDGQQKYWILEAAAAQFAPRESDEHGQRERRA